MHRARRREKWSAGVLTGEARASSPRLPLHAELRIGDAALYLSGEHPDINWLSPKTIGGTATMLHVNVDETKVEDLSNEEVTERAKKLNSVG